MKYILFLIVTMASYFNCYSQIYEKEYVDSFNKNSGQEIISFGKLINMGEKMTVHEALEYVYKGDTSKLYCVQKIFNMETEKVSGVSRELFLPNKCLQIDLNNCILIANTSFDCQDVNKLSKVELILSLIDKDYRLTDTLIVYEGNDYDYDFSGLINTINGKIFITGFEKTIGRYAKLYAINQESLEFEIIKEKNNAEINSENWEKEIEKLGWKEDFMSQ